MTSANQIGARAARFSPRPDISHVVFDFDGTLSWLRHGWPELMASLFLKQIPETEQPRALSLPKKNVDVRAGSQTHVLPLPTVHDQLLVDILSLNGKSSIYQMERCAQRVAEHGGPKLDPQKMLSQYQAALQKAIAERKQKVKPAAGSTDEFVIHGARAFLRKLHDRGLVLILLSGTAEEQVKAEAELLGLAHFFGPHIYGSTADVVGSSKQAVIERLIRDEAISGERLLSFGDGPVEIRLTKKAGGLAIGVASDEDHNGSGSLHPQKVPLLLDAGADLLIPDYRQPDMLVKTLLGS